MLTPTHGSREFPIDLTDDIFDEPAKHWSKLFEQQLSVERTVDNPLNGASMSASYNGLGNVLVDDKKFRINAKSVFLTYPQCSLEKQILLNFLASLKHETAYIIVCKEKHKDGTPHLHAVVNFKKKVDIRRNNYFDLNGFHPNIQSTKNINASIQYCKKENDFIEEGALATTGDRLSKLTIPEYVDVMKLLDDLLVGYE